MRTRSAQWLETGSSEARAKLEAEQDEDVAKIQKEYGIYMHRNKEGYWIIDIDEKHPENVGEELYKAYQGKQLMVYHTGGIVGDDPGLKNDEIMAKLQKGEVVVSNKDKDALYDVIDFVSILSKKMYDTSTVQSNPFSNVTDNFSVPNVSKSNSIHFGDVYIYGNAGEDTVAKHKEINRKFANDVLSYIKLNK